MTVKAEAARAIRGKIPLPSEIPDFDGVRGSDAFVLKGGLVDVCFIRRSPVLYVTFDNLASVGEYDPPQPWLHARMAKKGFSILGLMASRKDWYRNDDTPQLLTGLRDAGLFEGFKRIVFTGTSMGGYAALTYSRLVPGAVVLAFSPQSTLNTDIATFETRYKYARRKWDWQSPDFLDAADGVAAAREVWLFYDPFVPEDRAHAARIEGPTVRHMKCGHFGHRLIRQLKSCGVLETVFDEIGRGTFDPMMFRKALRARRDIKVWRKEFLGNLERAGHLGLASRVAEMFLSDDPKARYARKLQQRIAVSETVESVPAPGKKRIADAGPIVEEILLAEGNPQPPFRGAVLKVRGAIVVPERDHDTRLASGVLLADRSYCEMSRAWIRAMKSTPEPILAADETIEKLPGRHLFAGHMRGHFGHFLVESTARLWAMEALGDRIDSILYLPYRGHVTQTRRAMAGHKEFFRLLGLDVPIQTFGTAIEVEELYVPELGFGWLERYAGSPLYRRFMRERLGAGIAAQGSAKLYVSRSRLPSQRGGVLGETVIEENLARQGYEVFHPEKHSLEEQIARYKAARQIVALDGSALHLAAYFLREKGKVAIILRRSKANAADYVLQYRSFCGVTPDVVDVIRKDWISGEAGRVDFRSVGELDFAKLFGSLAQFGYIDKGFKPELPTKGAIARMLKEFSERRSEEFASVGGEGDED
ncbi:MAG: glycosyltransferase 61 family protein [Paracoccaceae bacterium]